MDSPELERHATSIAQTLGLQPEESRPRVDGISLCLSATNVSLTLARVKKVTKAALVVAEEGLKILRSPHGGDDTFELMVFTDPTQHGCSHLFLRYKAQARELTMACIRSSDELAALRQARK